MPMIYVSTYYRISFKKDGTPHYNLILSIQDIN